MVRTDLNGNIVSAGSGSTAEFLPRGLRKLGGALAWIRTYNAWETKDGDALRKYLRTAIQFDPKNFHYWINGARMLVYDVPLWQLDQNTSSHRVPEQMRQKLQEAAAVEGLGLLHLAETSGLRSPWLAIEAGSIQWFIRRDFNAAFGHFRRAALQPQAPYFAGRLAAECLRRDGQLIASYQWLLEYQKSLPVSSVNSTEPHENSPEKLTEEIRRGRGDPQIELVLTRIRQLEMELEHIQ